MRRANAAGALLCVAWLAAGCGASIHEIRRHPQQERLERLTGQVTPHTKYPEKHYWVRVSEPDAHHIGLTILPHRHIYLSSQLLEEADDDVVLVLLAHGIAHHRLHHHTTRGLARLFQRIVFKVAGAFVPGLSYGTYLGDPIAEAASGANQEAGADDKTAAYLARMGKPPETILRALEWMQTHGYRERVGRLVLSDHEWAPRLAHLRRSDGRL